MTNEEYGELLMRRLSGGHKHETYVDEKAYKGQDVTVCHEVGLPGAFISATSSGGVDLYPDTVFNSVGEPIGTKWFKLNNKGNI